MRDLFYLIPFFLSMIQALFCGLPALFCLPVVLDGVRRRVPIGHGGTGPPAWGEFVGLAVFVVVVCCVPFLLWRGWEEDWHPLTIVWIWLADLWPFLLLLGVHYIAHALPSRLFFHAAFSAGPPLLLALAWCWETGSWFPRMKMKKRRKVRRDASRER